MNLKRYLFAAVASVAASMIRKRWASRRAARRARLAERTDREAIARWDDEGGSPPRTLGATRSVRPRGREAT